MQHVLLCLARHPLPTAVVTLDQVVPSACPLQCISNKQPKSRSARITYIDCCLCCNNCSTCAHPGRSHAPKLSVAHMLANIVQF
jgi:hypothetical protein